LVVLLPAPARGQAGERLSDNDVKQIIEAVDHGRDRFEDQLDGKVKNATLRGPRGEVKVQDYLQDLQDNVNKLKERFDRNYSAGAEATTVLRQGTDIHNYFTAQSADMRMGSSGAGSRTARRRLRHEVSARGRRAGAAHQRR
jgi:hypothetical protein